MIKKISVVFIVPVAFVFLFSLPSCKSCNKPSEQNNTTADTTSALANHPINSINLPHADTSLIPVLTKILDESFAASAQKDYAHLASLIIYRGPDPARLGQDVFNAKNNYEKNVVRITADVFNKWNRNIESHDYTRVFDMDQPGGRKMAVLEVIFVSKKSIERKFFGFVKVHDSYKIVDVTSNL